MGFTPSIRVRKNYPKKSFQQDINKDEQMCRKCLSSKMTDYNYYISNPVDFWIFCAECESAGRGIAMTPPLHHGNLEEDRPHMIITRTAVLRRTKNENQKWASGNCQSSGLDRGCPVDNGPLCRRNLERDARLTALMVDLRETVKSESSRGLRYPQTVTLE